MNKEKVLDLDRKIFEREFGKVDVLETINNFYDSISISVREGLKLLYLEEETLELISEDELIKIAGFIEIIKTLFIDEGEKNE